MEKEERPPKVEGKEKRQRQWINYKHTENSKQTEKQKEKLNHIIMEKEKLPLKEIKKRNMNMERNIIMEKEKPPPKVEGKEKLATMDKLQTIGHDRKAKREAKPYYYGEGETTTEGDKEEKYENGEKYYYGEGETTTEDGKVKGKGKKKKGSKYGGTGCPPWRNCYPYMGEASSTSEAPDRKKREA